MSIPSKSIEYLKNIQKAMNEGRMDLAFRRVKKRSLKTRQKIFTSECSKWLDLGQFELAKLFHQSGVPWSTLIAPNTTSLLYALEKKNHGAVLFLTNNAAFLSDQSQSIGFPAYTYQNILQGLSSTESHSFVMGLLEDQNIPVSFLIDLQEKIVNFSTSIFKKPNQLFIDADQVLTARLQKQRLETLLPTVPKAISARPNRI